MDPIEPPLPSDAEPTPPPYLARLAGASGSDDASLTCAHPPAPWERALGVVAWLAALGLGLAGLCGAHRALRTWLEVLPLPTLARELTVGGLLVLAPLAVPLAAQAWLRRYRGSCWLLPHELYFSVPGVAQPVGVRRERVAGYQVTDAGIVLRVAGRGLLARACCPLVVHPHEAQVERVLAYLEATPAGEPGPVSAGRAARALPGLVTLLALGPLVVQGLVVPAFDTMFANVGVALPTLSKAVLEGRVLVATWVLTLLALARWGTWAPSRCAGALVLVILGATGASLLGLFLPLIDLMERL